MTVISSSRSLLYLKTLAPSSSASSTPTPGLFISFPHRAAAASAFGRRGEAVRSGNQRPPALRAMAADREYSSRRSSGSSNTESKERNLLPGCDLSHWLVLTDFPKDPAPTREQMIETCLNTLAAVLGSMEEAKNLHWLPVHCC